MTSHVTIFMSWGGKGFYGLGGNQSGGVRVSNFSTRNILAYVEPY